MMALAQLVAEARVLAGDMSADLCSTLGHHWETDGGRPCPFYETARYCDGSQPVYKCTRCPAFDYGEPGGPAHADCKNRRCGS